MRLKERAMPPHLLAVGVGNRAAPRSARRGEPQADGGLRRRRSVASMRARGLSAPLPQSLGRGFLGSHQSLRLISVIFLARAGSDSGNGGGYRRLGVACV